MKVLHIITGLGNGGAEGVLYRLCKYDDNNTHIVISLTDEGKFGSLLKSDGINVHCLQMKKGLFMVSRLFFLYKLLKKINPDIIQTWMYHADLLGGIIARLAGFKNVYWNIRHTTFESINSKKSTLLVARFCANLSSYIPAKIICCAHKSLVTHAELGYKKNIMRVVPNGYDTIQFSPNVDSRFIIRSEFNIKNDIVVLGMVGRFHHQKNHLGLLKALFTVKKSISNFKLLLIGNNLNYKNQLLTEAIESYNLMDNIILLDQRSDIPALMNAIDINILSSSSGEGFPNVIAEGMSCGTPCVSTNIGDASLIIDDTGWIVESSNVLDLANSIIKAIEEKKSNNELWRIRQNNCRVRITTNYSIETMISNYYKVWNNEG